MASTIHISLSPNTQPDDITQTRQTLRHCEHGADTTIRQEVEDHLAVHLRQPAVLTSSGRAALYRLLQAYGIGQGDEVIIQAFTCSVVPAAIQFSQATPIYADISPATYNLDPVSVQSKITSRTRAVIVQHTFGIPGPITELRQLCDEHSIILIEDCAHALGATYQGHPVGSFGDASFFSFGRDKIISSIFGGGISSRDPKLLADIRATQATLPLPPQWWVKQQLRHPLLMQLALPWYFTAKLGQILIMSAQKLQLISKAVSASEKAGAKPPHVEWQYAPALARLLLHQLKKLDRYTERRQQIAARYLNELQKLSTTLPLIPLATMPAWLRFPLQIAHPSQLHEAAKRQHIVVGDWYDTPIAPKDVSYATFGYQSGSCPQAEKVCQHTINLPTHPRLSDSDVDRIIACVKSVL